jgi:hypothetical protein
LPKCSLVCVCRTLEGKPALWACFCDMFVRFRYVTQVMRCYLSIRCPVCKKKYNFYLKRRFRCDCAHLCSFGSLHNSFELVSLLLVTVGVVFTVSVLDFEVRRLGCPRLNACSEEREHCGSVSFRATGATTRSWFVWIGGLVAPRVGLHGSRWIHGSHRVSSLESLDLRCRPCR